MNKEYVKYLNSETWKNTKNRFYKSKYNKNKCYICGEKDVPLDLHHKTYERVGCERLADLVQVCRPCHKSIHLILDHCKGNEFTLWNVAKKCKTLFRKQGKKAFINIIPTAEKPLPIPKKKNNKKVSLKEHIENTPVITLTKRIMRFGKSCKNGLSMKQLRILGVTKEKKDWKKQILGKEFPQHVIKQFLDLKNEHIDWEKEEFNESKKKKKKSKRKKLQLHEKAYGKLCNFEKNSEKTVKLRKKTKTFQ